MRVSIAPGSAWTAGTPASSSRPRPMPSAATATPFDLFRTYDVSLDGRRFLMIKNADPPAQPQPRRGSSSSRTGSRS